MSTAEPLRLHYLGPVGSFTHQAAQDAAHALAAACAGRPSPELVPCDTAADIFEAVESKRGLGVIAWENNVEGYVTPNLDALIDARDLVGIGRNAVDISFDAMARPGDARPVEITAHPHGLAQCKGFIDRMGLPAMPAVSNAAACRDLKDGQIALGPSLCAGLYGLRTVERDVQDYRGGRTEFLVIAPRTWLGGLRPFDGHDEFESIIAFIPLVTGAGVLANLLDVLRDQGLNMTSFISRPIKGNDGTYSFIATFDAAPWEPRFRDALREIADHGDWVKTLAVYPRRERPDPPVETWMLPEGGVHVDDAGSTAGTAEAPGATGERYPHAGRELLWDGPAAWDGWTTQGTHGDARGTRTASTRGNGNGDEA